MVLHQSTAWFTHHPRDSCTDLHSFGATASSFSSSSHSSSVVPLSLHSSRGALGHHSRSHQWGTRAITVGRLDTLLRNVCCQDKPIHHIPQHRWQTSRRANREAQCSDLATPTTPPWRRYSQGRKFLRVHSSSMNTPSLYCLILELHMIS
jgi:hypothetical protein